MKLVLVIGIYAIAIALSLAEEKFVCKDGVNYVENDCNRCFCNKGNLSCTLRACFGEHHERLEKCTVGATFKRNCNDCWCAKDLGTICTSNKC